MSETQTDSSILSDKSKVGRRLAHMLQNSDVKSITVRDLMDALVRTWQATIFAEKAGGNFGIQGNGDDWTEREIALSGRLGYVVKDVSVGTRRTELPFMLTEEDTSGLDEHRVHFLFTNGPLLNGPVPCDKTEVVDSATDKITLERLTKYYEARLLPLFAEAQNMALERGKDAVIALPALGAGQFAGKYKKVGEQPLINALETVFQQILITHRSSLPNIRALVFDRWSDRNVEAQDPAPIHADNGEAIGAFFIREASGALDGPRVGPGILAEAGKHHASLEGCMKFVVPAGDHISIAMNDAASGSPQTNEGGTTAPTNIAAQIYTAEDGVWTEDHMYVPAIGKTWCQYADENEVVMAVGTVSVISESGERLEVLPAAPGLGFRPEGVPFLLHKNASHAVPLVEAACEEPAVVPPVRVRGAGMFQEKVLNITAALEAAEYYRSHDTYFCTAQLSPAFSTYLLGDRTQLRQMSNGWAVFSTDSIKFSINKGMGAAGVVLFYNKEAGTWRICNNIFADNNGVDIGSSIEAINKIDCLKATADAVKALAP